MESLYQAPDSVECESNADLEFQVYRMIVALVEISKAIQDHGLREKMLHRAVEILKAWQADDATYKAKDAPS